LYLWYITRAMSSVRRWIVGLFGLLLAVQVQAATDTLDWRQFNGRERVSADITTWVVQVLHENVAAATGWEIYVEPGAKERVSTKFKDRSPGEALSRLLGNLSYALLPQTNGPSKLYVFRNSRSDATLQVKAAKKKKLIDETKPIENELIVKLKPGANIDDIAKALGAKVVGRLDDLNAYRLQFEDGASADAARKSLDANEKVESIENNYPISRPEQTAYLNQGSGAAMNLNVKPGDSNGKTIIGLIDTAVQRGGPMDAFLMGSESVAGEATPGTDYPTHGTAMLQALLLGAQAGVNGQATLDLSVYHVDAYGNNANTTTFQLAQAVIKAMEAGANSLNISSGGPVNSPMLEQVIQLALKNGINIYAAAGNEPTGQPVYPAAIPGVTGVGALGRDGTPAPFSNFGEHVDIYGPGTVPINFNNQPLWVSGTSPATAYEAGKIAVTKPAASK
jgi:thermitase